MSTQIEQPVTEMPALPLTIAQLNQELDTKIHLLASTGDETLAQQALEATKAIFEIGLHHEQDSHQHLHPFLLQILEPPSVSLRSKSKAKAEQAKDLPKGVEPASILPYTPLSNLTTENMDIEQIWAQLELRTEGIAEVIKQVGPGTGVDEDQEDMEGEEGEGEDDEEDGSDEEMSVEEFKRMMMEQGIDEDADSDKEMGEEGEWDDVDEDEDDDDEDLSEDEGGDGELDDEESDEDDTVRFRDEDGELGSLGSDEDDEDEDEDEEEEDASQDDLDGSEDGVDDNDDGEDDQSALFGNSEPGPSRHKKHPTLDDEFFSIDEFNRLTEEAEASRLSSGRLGGEEDEDEDDLGDAGAMMLQGAGDEDASIMYSDFFDVPRGNRAAGPIKGKGKSKTQGGKAKDTKGKGKAKLRFADEDEYDEDGEEEEDEEDAGRDVMTRFKGDLFDDESEDEVNEKKLSTHEKQQLALAKQIAELEQEAIGPKDWTLLGEATSRARPENSLLEEDLDFESVAKVVPVITEESVKSLEDLIKRRILDNNFDSPVRVRAYEPTPYLPSRFFDVQDTQSSKSLAQIYEEEYQTAAAGGKAKDPRDEKLRKDHEEIEKIWGEICYKLDALSSLNFVPKQPKAQITTIENLPTTTMESALPPTSAATTLLAPEELFAPPSSGALVARSELTPEQAQAARMKRKREKKGDTRKLGNMAELYGKKGGVKGEKERALKELVKTGKGVTVVGKGAKEAGKAKKRGDRDEGGREDGKRLKL